MLVYRKKAKDSDDNEGKESSKKDKKSSGGDKGISFDRGNKGIYLPGAGTWEFNQMLIKYPEIIITNQIYF